MPTVARVLWLFPRRRRMTRLLAWAAIACASCAEPLPSPTRSSAAAPEGAVPLLSVRVDGDSAATAIVQVSEVTFDASGTRGDKLRYAIDFGDGEAAATPVASHVYRREGTFMATLRVTDAAGRESVISAPVVVRALQGAWFQAGLNAEARRFEVHRLAVTAQEGAEVRGVYSYWGEVDRLFTGRLASGRHLSLAVDGGAVRFEGTVPAEMAAGGFPLTLLVQGGSASGQTLRFDPVPPDPPRAPPQARLHVTSGVPGISEFIYEGLEATFDASGSTGDGLTYFMELGDGHSARGSGATRAARGADDQSVSRGHARSSDRRGSIWARRRGDPVVRRAKRVDLRHGRGLPQLVHERSCWPLGIAGARRQQSARNARRWLVPAPRGMEDAFYRDTDWRQPDQNSPRRRHHRVHRHVRKDVPNL